MSTAEALRPEFGVGDRIRKARKDAGLKQKDLATIVGVSRPQVAKWERNIVLPDLLEALEIAKATRHSLGWIAGADPSLRCDYDSPMLTSQNRLFDVESLGRTHRARGELVAAP